MDLSVNGIKVMIHERDQALGVRVRALRVRAFAGSLVANEKGCKAVIRSRDFEPPFACRGGTRGVSGNILLLDKMLPTDRTR